MSWGHWRETNICQLGISSVNLTTDIVRLCYSCFNQLILIDVISLLVTYQVQRFLKNFADNGDVNLDAVTGSNLYLIVLFGYFHV